MSVSPYSVAVIIPTYNRVRLLEQALDSVLGQTRPPDDVVVVDDGSTDATADMLSHHGDRIRYLYQKNAGKPAALNNALKVVNADYIWIMDDDDVALADALERHLDFLQVRSSVDFTYSGVYCFDTEAKPPPVTECQLWQRPEIPHAEFFIKAMELFPCNLQTMLVPLKCYHAVGPYDESLTFSEDYEMILRIARKYHAGRLEDPTIFLRQHSGLRGPEHERRTAAERWKAWRPYDMKIFMELRETLALNEYLPRNVTTEPLNMTQTRQALLQRACIMTRHGLFTDALQDLDAATEETLCGEPYSKEEKQICGRMLNVEPENLDGDKRFLQNIGRLLRRRAPSLLESAAAGLSWSARQELRAGRYGGAARIVVDLVRLAGPNLFEIAGRTIIGRVSTLRK